MMKDFLLNYKRPLLVAGHGIRLAGALNLFYKLLEKLNIPVVTTFNGFDIVPSDHPNFAGRIGTVGTPEGNKILSEADVVIFLGTRNNIRQKSYDWDNFAKNSVKFFVDIDEYELEKHKLLKNIITKKIDVKEFIINWLNEL